MKLIQTFLPNLITEYLKTKNIKLAIYLSLIRKSHKH